jgi:AcrR family transcriptional regulator
VCPAGRLVKSDHSFYFWPMPRVSEAHLAARRRQILDAARTCFMRNGFHATSMQDVIAEAHLSVGAFYRYFKSKHELIEAIASGYVDTVWHTALEAAEGSWSLVELMTIAVRIMDTATGPDGQMRLAFQIWAESLRDERIAAIVSAVYSTLRGNFVEVARRGVATGELPEGSDPDEVGAALFSLVIGYAVQRMLTGSPDHDRYIAGLRVLLR